MDIIAANGHLQQAAEHGSSGAPGTLAVIGVVISLMALGLAAWSSRSAHLSAVTGQRQAATAWQQLADHDPDAGPVFVLSKPRWHGRSVRIRVEQVPGLTRASQALRAAQHARDEQLIAECSGGLAYLHFITGRGYGRTWCGWRSLGRRHRGG